MESITIGSRVTSIGSDAFCGCTKLESITIPNKVTSIGSSVFSGCSALKSITIPNSVTSIGNYAFCGCTKLESITLPNKVASIGMWAFYSCVALESITIPNSVTSIGSNAFDNCSGLKEVHYTGTESDRAKISIGSNNTPLTNATWYYGLASGDCGSGVSWILKGDGTLVVSGTGAMADYSAENPAPWSDKAESITAVVVESGVTAVGSGAFSGCDKLTGVTLPKTTTQVGNDAFAGCTALASVNYGGTAAAWKRMTIGTGNEKLTAATRTTQPVAEHDHTWDAGEITQEPTYDDEGVKTFHCTFTDCEEIKTEPVAKKERVYIAAIGEQRYETLPAAVEAAASGAVITLLKDAQGDGVVVNKNLTIDFGGYTYTVMGEKGNGLVGSSGTETQGMQLLRDNRVTLRNGTLKTGTNACKMLVQNYSDLTVVNMTLDGTGSNQMQYVLSNNFGSIQIQGQTDITAPEGAVAFDVCCFGSYRPAPVVNVATSGTITGRIEVSDTATLNISAGTFTVPLERSWCAAGFVPAERGDGTYGVAVAPTGAASIGDAVYDTLAAAIDAAQDGDHIMLKANATAPEAGVGKEITIVNPGYALAGELVAAAGYEMTVTTVGGITIYSFKSVVAPVEPAVAKIGDTYYTSVDAALKAATSGQTVEMIADSDETGSTLVLNEGVTLNLSKYTLTAKALVGAEGSCVTGTRYNKDGSYAKLKVNTLVLDSFAHSYETTSGATRNEIPVWHPTENAYIITFYNILDNVSGNKFEIDETDKTIFYQFTQTLGRDARTELLSDGSSDNKLNVCVTMSWDSGTDGRVEWNFTYKDEFVENVSLQTAGKNQYTFTIKDYEALGVDLGSLTVQAYILTDSGVRSDGTVRTQSNQFTA